MQQMRVSCWAAAKRSVIQLTMIRAIFPASASSVMPGAERSAARSLAELATRRCIVAVMLLKARLRR